MGFNCILAKPDVMKPLLHYGTAERSIRRGYQNPLESNCVNESEERDARLREGIAMRDLTGKQVIPQVFAGYGNGPFLMPTLHLPR